MFLCFSGGKLAGQVAVMAASSAKIYLQETSFPVAAPGPLSLAPQPHRSQSESARAKLRRCHSPRPPAMQNTPIINKTN